MFERLRSVGETADHNYQLPVTQAELGKQLAGMETRAMDEAFNLRKRAIWYREFAERAGNPWIWEARLRRADELEKEAAHLEKEPSPNRQEAEAA